MHRCINIDQTTLFVIGDLGSQTLRVKGNMMNKKVILSGARFFKVSELFLFLKIKLISEYILV